MNLTDIRDIKALLARHGFRFSKSMGQNFLIADWVPRDIADAAGLDGDCGVLEIGPGIGPLTVELARRAGRVAAVELDGSLLPILRETLADCPNVEVIPGDIMKLDVAQLASDRFSGLAVKACANLPYNITTPVITKLLEAGCFRTITLMIQREVARRVCAAPGDSDCGAFSLFCQYHVRAAVRGAAGLLPARPQGHLRRGAADAPGGPAGGGGQGRHVRGGAGRIRPAAENPAQRAGLRLWKPLFQGGAAADHRGLRPAGAGAGGTAGAGGLRRAGPGPGGRGFSRKRLAAGAGT